MDSGPNVVPQWLCDVVKHHKTVCYGDPASIERIDDGLQAWANEAEILIHCWKTLLFAYKKLPTQADEWETQEAAAYIWSAKTLPALVCPVCMFSRRFDMHTDTARPCRAVRVSCTPYPQSYRRSSPWAATNVRRSRTRTSMEGTSRCATCCG